MSDEPHIEGGRRPESTNRAVILEAVGALLFVVGLASGLLAASDYESIDGGETAALWIAAFWTTAGPGIIAGAITACAGLLIETIEAGRRR